MLETDAGSSEDFTDEEFPARILASLASHSSEPYESQGWVPDVDDEDLPDLGVDDETDDFCHDESLSECNGRVIYGLGNQSSNIDDQLLQQSFRNADGIADLSSTTPKPRVLAKRPEWEKRQNPLDPKTFPLSKLSIIVRLDMQVSTKPVND
jgi:hypothetical protein